MTAGERAPTASLRLAELLHGDRVVITDNLAQPLAEVVKPESLSQLAGVLEGLSDGWTSPPSGIPIATVRLNFYADGAPHGNLGVGPDFLAAHVHGGFLCRASDLDTARSLLRALGIGHLMPNV
jgi:hypothetical protein